MSSAQPIFSSGQVHRISPRWADFAHEMFAAFAADCSIGFFQTKKSPGGLGHKILASDLNEVVKIASEFNPDVVEIGYYRSDVKVHDPELSLDHYLSGVPFSTHDPVLRRGFNIMLYGLFLFSYPGVRGSDEFIAYTRAMLIREFLESLVPISPLVKDRNFRDYFLGLCLVPGLSEFDSPEAAKQQFSSFKSVARSQRSLHETVFAFCIRDFYREDENDEPSGSFGFSHIACASTSVLMPGIDPEIFFAVREFSGKDATVVYYPCLLLPGANMIISVSPKLGLKQLISSYISDVPK